MTSSFLGSLRLLALVLMAAPILFPVSSFAGMSQEEVKAFSDYKIRALKGEVEAQSAVGDCYMNGEGVGQDFAQAVVWYQKAAESGYANAQSELASCYSKGFGVEKDERVALSWRLKAAKQGHTIAQYNLGITYLHGYGVPKDSVEAYAYLNLASASEIASITRRSKAALCDIESRMSREDFALGQRRTRELQAEIQANLDSKRTGK